MKNLINGIFLWMGYIPLDSTVNVVKEQAHLPVAVQAERAMPNFDFSSKFETDSYMNQLLRDMRHEIADKSSDAFEVIQEFGLSFNLSASDQDRGIIRLRLNIIPSSQINNQ